MKGILTIASILLLASASFGSTGSFKYVSKAGHCADSTGNLGWNLPDLSKVFVYDPGKDLSTETPTISGQKLECADLTNVNFRGTLNSDARYVQLKSWNLKGADLSGTDVTWMVFVKGTLEGADLTKTHMGYTQFRGVRVDANTKGLPPQCLETLSKGIINCQK